ncbi:hypothetical protein ANCCEY_06980 [Ancylostoma ceylanicum]|uniref:Transmembrane protein 65 n=1 Tax=Ancylostoma ceylanicum TaxID=53326 RepID=A0A0D6LRU7_9BILA|nr:hypothetical protein ANCCEY_06980 [Ancylostoma ceylanicum]
MVPEIEEEVDMGRQEVVEVVMEATAAVVEEATMQLGTMLCLSTMAAAALGNLISDVAGVGLAHYVESMFHKIGLKHPVLTSEQLESSRARWTTHSARAFGLTIGCLVGMFPLLFFNNEKEEKKEELPPK